MSSDLDILASFSPDASSFAFKSSGLHKKFVDIYPLSTSTNYRVNSSLVNHIDYERDDLNMEELKFAAWTSSSSDGNSTKSKRKFSEDERISSDHNKHVESYFLNTFAKGKIVIFSPSGNEILNIIQNKKEIVGLDTNGSSIWILDEDKTVKHFKYNSTKALKTFHLIDGKEDDISSFQLLNFKSQVYISIVTDECMYVIDPSKRRPSRVALIELPGIIACTAVDEELIAIADIAKVYLYSLTKNEIVFSWEIEAVKLKNFGDYIIAQGIDGTVSVLPKNDAHVKCVVRVCNSEILDFVTVGPKIIIAWLNVNEPSFETLSPGPITENTEIVFNEQDEVAPQQTSKSNTEEKTVEPKKTVSRIEHTNETEVLIKSLEDNTPLKDVLRIIESAEWSEQQIKSVVRSQLSEDQAKTVFEIAMKQIGQNPWSTNRNLSYWLKWLITIRGSDIPAIQNQNHSTNKTVKQTRSSLKSCRDTFPALLSMQGKLEMLREQSKLRQELSKLDIEDDNKSTHALNGKGDETDILYVNGEGDEYVDALEYNE